MKGRLWITIGRLVQAGLLPEPKIVAQQDSRLSVKLRSKAAVDQWCSHLGMPPAVVTGIEYSSHDFPPAPGWVGYTAITVYCELPGGPSFGKDELRITEQILSAVA